MSIRKVYTTLNVRKAESQTTIEGLHVGDVGSTQLVISLMDGTRAIDLTQYDNVTAMIHGKKPDGYEIHNECDVTTDPGKIIYTLTAQDTAVSGTVYYQLDVQINSEERSFSPCFRTQVSERVYEPVFELLTEQEPPTGWAQHYAEYYKKVNGVYVQNNDSTYAANTFYQLMDPPVQSMSQYLAFWAAYNRVTELFNQRLVIDDTTENIGYEANAIHKVYIKAKITEGLYGIVFTGQDNKQYALCNDGLLRTRTYSGSYSDWAVTALRVEITSSNKNSTKLIPSIKAVVDYIASEISGKANADEVNAALAEKANVNHTHDMSNYVTLQALIAALANKADTSAVPTKTSDLTNDSGFLTEHQDLSPYALAANVAASLALKADEENAVKYIEYLAGISSLADNQINDKKTIYRVWDSSFGWGLMFNVIASNVNAQVVLAHNGQILYREKAKNETWQNKSFTNVLSGYATTSALESGLAGKAAADHTHSQYLTEHQDISGKADKATTLSGYGITDAYTKTETDSALSGKAALDHTHPQYLTEHQSLSNYYTKTEVDNTFASLDELNGELELYDGYLDNKENTSNKQTSISSSSDPSTDSSYYPTVGAVRSYVNTQIEAEDEYNAAHYLTSHQDISGKENTSNKVTSISSSSTDAQYPSAKCVYDIVGNIESLLAQV